MDLAFPIGPLEVPHNITKTTISKWLEQISTYTNRLHDIVTPLTEEQLQQTYRQGAWNVRQLVHHIADSQLNMYQRLKLALTDDTPTVPNFNQDAWALLPDTLLPVDCSIKMLEGINERIVALAETLSSVDLERAFIHEKNGKITVGTKLAKLCWHEEHHLAHIKLAIKN